VPNWLRGWRGLLPLLLICWRIERNNFVYMLKMLYE
jgi:hypothetical protein